jgi:effector-binding domain-containing protein
MEVATPVAAAIVAEPPADDHVRFRQVPGCALAAALVFEGPYEQVIGPIQALLKWIGVHRHAPAGPLRELHLSGPAHEENGKGSLPVIELQVPIVAIDTPHVR